jgi:tRNA(Ile)-lysidine synthase
MRDSHLALVMRAALQSLGSLPGDRLLVAVSGGADSTALIHLLGEEAPACELNLEIAVVDHGLRDVSAEIAHVRNLAAQWKLPFHRLAVSVSAKDGSLQAGARDARYTALRGLAEERSARWIALGHTRTDQTETVLMQLLRGTGLRGMAGMRALHGDLFRPLLDVSRREIEDWLTSRGASWMEDPTNANEVFTRNRVRRRLTPLLEELLPGSGDRIAACAAHLASDRDALEALADRALRETREAATGAGLALGSLREWPVGLWPHVLRQAVVEAGGDAPDRRQLASLMTLIATDAGTRGVDLPGLRAERIYGELVLTPAQERRTPGLFSVGRKEIGGPGCYAIGGGKWTFSQSEDCAFSPGEETAVFDTRSLRFPLEVRTLRRGDRMRPLGMDGSRLVSDILVDRKVPAGERNRALLLTDGQDVLWLVGVMRSAHHLVGAATTSVLRVKSPGGRAL